VHDVNPRNRLSWRDFGRGVLALRKKIRPGTRTLATLATMYDRRRLSLGRALERSAARHPDATCIKY
jgi:hypothetical protein